jgi:hypothetical protein
MPLTSANLQELIKLESISYEAFRSTLLTEIIIPTSVTSVGTGAFLSISTLQSICCYDYPSCLSLMDATTFTSSSKTNDDVPQCNLNHIDQLIG